MISLSTSRDAINTLLHLPVPNANTVKNQFISDYVKEGPICVYSPPKDERTCCIEYSGKTGACLKCAKGLVLNGDGICQDVKIAGCLEKNADGYGCASCAKGIH